MSLAAWYVCRAAPVSRTPASRIALSALSAAVLAASVWAILGEQWWRALGAVGVVDDARPPPGLFEWLFALGGLTYLLSVTLHYVWQAFEDSAIAARQALEAAIAQRDAELRALRAQLDPHFLFNSLNSIAGLIGADPGKARLMCQMLGDFLRD